MRNFKSLVISVILLVYSTYSHSFSTDPKEFINELVNEAITKLSDNDLSKEEKFEFIENIALTNVDINALGLYTLGELRKSSKEQDIANFQKAFEQYFLKNLTSRLSDYSASKFELIGADKKSSNYTIVKTKIKPEDGDPEIKIDWRIYTKKS